MTGWKRWQSFEGVESRAPREAAGGFLQLRVPEGQCMGKSPGVGEEHDNWELQKGKMDGLEHCRGVGEQEGPRAW